MEPQLSNKDLETIVQVIKGKIDDEFGRAMGTYQSELDKMQRAGMEANDKRVLDLEKRLAEAEKKHDENVQSVMKQHGEEIRLLEAQIASAKLQTERLGVDLRPGDRGYAPDYKSQIGDVAVLRNLVRAQNPSMYGMSAEQVRTITSGTSIASAGALTAEVADTFIDNIVALNPTLRTITTRRMMANQAHLDEILVAARSLRTAVEGTAPTDANAFSFSRRTLTTIEVIWPENITLSFLEDNIEKRNAEGTIAAKLATAFGNDLNDLAWNGTSDGTGSFLACGKGFQQILTDDAGEQVYTATNDLTAQAVLQGMHKAMPAKYKGRTDLTFFCSIPFAEHYANEVSVRETAQGDSVLLNGLPALRYFGRPIVSDSHLSSAGASNTMAYFTPAPNFVFGIQRQMSVDSMWQPRTRVIEYTVTARVDFQIAVMDAVVRTATIPSALQ